MNLKCFSCNLVARPLKLSTIALIRPQEMDINYATMFNKHMSSDIFQLVVIVLPMYSNRCRLVLEMNFKFSKIYRSLNYIGSRAK